MKYIKIAILSVIMAFVPFSCSENEEEYNSKGYYSFIYDVFYYNSFSEYTIEDGIKKHSIIRVESGTIRMHEDYIAIHRTDRTEIYIILESYLDEETGVRYFYTENEKIIYDASNKRLQIETDEKVFEYYINPVLEEI